MNTCADNGLSPCPQFRGSTRKPGGWVSCCFSVEGLEEPPRCCPAQLHHVTSPPANHVAPISPRPHRDFSDGAALVRGEVVSPRFRFAFS